ncbi:carboxypeptidase-like regulatory domain-containing protein [Larkinella humicola]|uniref:Carboxypeptidase regulatory-like domain-containing protein n=1 Tax=Larkinella humicola TaxID=2607654 RepID=A0A5N1JCH8_9BACT|nr:carboxypeptidase-like regulatory domain-containing protein [Larkinella humicola]KAA9349453.1 carboxypeptidase regulatory-like domain-containing protein [Larkinella humicola]
MKSTLYSLLAAALIGLSSCSHSTPEPDIETDVPSNPQEGVVSGRVVDSQGKPVANATIVASSTDYHNRTSTGYTDAKGNYRFVVPTGIAAGSYTVTGSFITQYQGRKYTLALYNPDTRVFSAYDGAVRNFVFRLTGKRNIDDDAAASPLGGTMEVRPDFNTTIRENIEVTLEPDGPLVDGSTGKKIVARLSDRSDSIEDVPVGKYKITARDVVTGQKLGVSIADSFKPYAPSVTGLFVDDRFEGSTLFRLDINISTL